MNRRAPILDHYFGRGGRSELERAGPKGPGTSVDARFLSYVHEFTKAPPFAAGMRSYS